MGWRKCWCVWCHFRQHISDIWSSRAGVTKVAQSNWFLCVSYFDRKPMNWSKICDYVNWFCKSRGYSGRIILNTLQTRLHVRWFDGVSKQTTVSCSNKSLINQRQTQVCQALYLSGIFKLMRRKSFKWHVQAIMNTWSIMVRWWSNVMPKFIAYW